MSDQFIKDYDQLPRREGKLNDQLLKVHGYKKDFVVSDSNPIEYNKNILRNGGRLLSFDTSQQVLQVIANYDYNNYGGLYKN